MITQVIFNSRSRYFFYAIPAKEHVRKWCEDTPENFRFVVKAYQGMTGHLRGEIPFESKNDMFNAFIECANEFKRYGKLAMVLAQFPPWFDCQGKMCNIYCISDNSSRILKWRLSFEIKHGTQKMLSSRR